MAKKITHHILIAGTGRAGTSVLVQYLSAVGLETMFGDSGAAVNAESFSNAGFEQDLLSMSSANWPYVIKSPWAFESIDQLLGRKDIVIDTVLVPMCDLAESSSSRVILERGAVLLSGHESAAEMANWENWGTTPGGVVYSLNPIDQGRLLAVGFHCLMCKLVEREVPVIFLSFPKFTIEHEYLFRNLKTLLPQEITPEKSEELFRRIFKKDKIRVGNEINEIDKSAGVKLKNGAKYPPKEVLTSAAYKREIDRTKKKAQEFGDQLVSAKLREKFLLLSLELSEKIASGNVETIAKYNRIVEKSKKSKLRDDVSLPLGFNALRYVTGHPDLFEAEVDPFEHFVFWGRFENRIW